MNSRHCLLTINDRLTNYVVIWKVQTLHPSSMAQIIAIALRGLPVHTITFDNGIEFGHHKTIEKLLKCKVYFTDTNSPQQRGANEISTASYGSTSLRGNHSDMSPSSTHRWSH